MEFDSAFVAEVRDLFIEKFPKSTSYFLSCLKNEIRINLVGDTIVSSTVLGNIFSGSEETEFLYQLSLIIKRRGMTPYSPIVITPSELIKGSSMSEILSRAITVQEL